MTSNKNQVGSFDKIFVFVSYFNLLNVALGK